MAIIGRPFKVDGRAIPTPTSYGFSVEDLSSKNSGRTLDGVMHKDVIAVKDTYECTWHGLSWADTADLLNALDGKTTFSFTHADPRVPGKFITGTFYVGKRNTVALNLNDPNYNWGDIKMSFIRV